MLSLRFKSGRNKKEKETNLSSEKKAGHYHQHYQSRSFPLHTSSEFKKKEDIPTHSNPQVSREEENGSQSLVNKKKRKRLINQDDQHPSVADQDKTTEVRKKRKKGNKEKRESGKERNDRTQEPTAVKSVKQDEHATEQQKGVKSGVSKKRKKRERKSMMVKATTTTTPGDNSTENLNSSSNSSSSSSREVEQNEENKRIELLNNFTSRGLLSSNKSQALIDRLHGGRFRALNEFLYKKEGKEALSKFQNNPKLFDIYHSGYRAQVRSWPLNPLDCVARWLEKQPNNYVVGDFGCGEAKLALRFPERKIHSFDLVAANERITPCDISNVPLKNASLDVAVFCLSLMGRDWPAFLREAYRVLKNKGHLVIAEVSSRVTSLPDLIKAIEGLGFKLNKQVEDK